MNQPHDHLPKWHIDRTLCDRFGDREPVGTRSNSGLIQLTHCYLTIYLRDTRLRIVDLKLQTADSRLQIVNSQLQIVALELQNFDPKLRVVDSKLQILDSELQNVDSELQNVHLKLQILDSKLQMLDSKLQNHAKTADRDRHAGSATAERNSPHHTTNLRGG